MGCKESNQTNKQNSRFALKGSCAIIIPQRSQRDINSCFYNTFSVCNVEFQINARWLLDLEEYNEWMNEEDYVVEEEVG